MGSGGKIKSAVNITRTVSVQIPQHVGELVITPVLKVFCSYISFPKPEDRCLKGLKAFMKLLTGC